MAAQEDQKHFDSDVTRSASPLGRSYTLSDEQFEKLYLNPKSTAQGDLRKNFGNPTPIAVMGFAMALTPTSISFMGWRGAGGAGVGTGADSMFFGGLLLVITGLLEFVVGNTFPSVVFFGYGSHFLTAAVTFIPSFGAVSLLSTSGTSQVQSPEFLDTFAFYTVSMGVLSFVFFLCAFRTNVVFLLVFTFNFLGFFLLTSAFWHLARGSAAMGDKLIIATGASFFVAAMLGWYLFLSLMLSIMDLPAPPVFDLSGKIKGMSERRMRKSHEP